MFLLEKGLNASSAMLLLTKKKLIASGKLKIKSFFFTVEV